MKTTEPQIHELLAHYFPAAACKVRSGASGMNNTTRFVEMNGERYVLRVYESHREEAKAGFEQEVLVNLSDLALPFRTPQPVATAAGERFLRTSEGKIAVLFRYMDGVNPASATQRELASFGRTAARLSKALSRVTVQQEPVYKPI